MFDPPLVPSRTPEHHPTSPEESDVFAGFLDGVHAMHSVSGDLSASSFVRSFLIEADIHGIDLDVDKLVAMCRMAFGSREEALGRIEGMGQEEFTESYPGDVGDLLLGYISPLFDE